jgi:hypothetical protein
MPAAAHGVPHRPEEGEDEADDQHDDADRPEDGDLRNKTDDEQDKPENYHRNLLFADYSRRR